MSDFLFSSSYLAPSFSSRALQSIYLEDPPPVTEFHGEWGTLAVTAAPYNGFAPVDTQSHLCVVIGAPVLYFHDNRFLVGDDDQAGSRAILERWQSGEADWAEDLSGPFAIIIVDKLASRIICITDLMMFLPVYRYRRESRLALGTHPDALARICGLGEERDEASLVDFILHHVVTYPYTLYRGMLQCQPATEHEFQLHNGGVYAFPRHPYWVPLESREFRTLCEAADTLRQGVEGYLTRVCEPMQRVAQFLSGGEDSRVVASMLPQRLEQDAFVFLNGPTREEKIAGKVAKVSGASFRPQYREPLHYLDILSQAARLVGSGHQYIHAHTLGFHRQCELSSYEGVFGGYLADALIKAPYARRMPGSKLIKFLPQISFPGETRTQEVKSGLFPKCLLDEVTQRRRMHFEAVREMRPRSAHEWFALWPMTMRSAISNLYSNRRLFRSYEMFTCKEAVKVSAASPTAWKLNRRLFLKAFQCYLKPTRFVLHADGRLPYLPWWGNLPLSALWYVRQLAWHTGLQQYQGSWADWKAIMASDRWRQFIADLTPEMLTSPVLGEALAKGALKGSELSRSQKINLVQVCVQTIVAEPAYPGQLTWMPISAVLNPALQEGEWSRPGR